MKPPEKIEMKTEEPEIEQPLKMVPKMNGYDADNEEEFPDDCFHMVTQYNWEEDIIWNGDDIKHKVRCNGLSWDLVFLSSLIVTIMK